MQRMSIHTLHYGALMFVIFNVANFKACLKLLLGQTSMANSVNFNSINSICHVLRYVSRVYLFASLTFN